MKLRAVALAAGLALVGAACGDDDGGGSVSTPGTDPAPPDADEVVVQVATGGGYVPDRDRLAEIPEITIYGDGRIVALGPTTEQSPPSALPNLQEGELDPQQLEEILDAASDAGILDDEPPDYGEPDVTDLPTTTVTVVADGEEHRVSAYALGFGEDDGLSDDEVEAREQLEDFVADLPTDDVDRDYEPDALAVYAQPYEEAELPDEDDVEVEDVEWPLDQIAGVPVESFTDTQCVLVEGDDVTTVVDAAEGVGTTARWLANDGEYALVFRPLLPHETACPFTDGEPTGGDPTGGDPETLLVQIDLGNNAWVGNPVTQLPEVSVYADGRIVVNEADPDSSSSEPITEVLELVVSEEGLERIIEAADDAGLLADEPPDYGEPGITDQGTTVVRLDVGDEERTIDVYALDFPGGTGGPDAEDLGLTDEQVEAREALTEFIEQVADPDFYEDTVEDEGTYEPAAFAVVYKPFDPEFDDAGYDPVTWPLADLADAGEPFERAGNTSRCLVVEGDDVATVLEAATGTFLQTPWVSGSAEYRLTFRPLLPDESTCTDVADRPTASGGGA